MLNVEEALALSPPPLQVPLPPIVHYKGFTNTKRKKFLQSTGWCAWWRRHQTWQLIATLIFIKIVTSINLSIYMALFHPMRRVWEVIIGIHCKKCIPHLLQVCSKFISQGSYHPTAKCNPLLSLPWPLPHSPQLVLSPPEFFSPSNMLSNLLIHCLSVVYYLSPSARMWAQSRHPLCPLAFCPPFMARLSPTLLSWLRFALLLPPPDSSRSTLFHPTHFGAW